MNNSDWDYMPLTYDVIERFTDRAVLFCFDCDSVWIPKSVIEEDVSDLDVRGGEVNVAEWFCEREDLEKYSK